MLSLAKDYVPHEHKSPVWCSQTRRLEPVRELIGHIPVQVEVKIKPVNNIAKQPKKPKVFKKINHTHIKGVLKKDGLTDHGCAVRLGRGVNFFVKMRNYNREKYDYIKKLGNGDLARGYVEYERMKRDAVDMTIHIFRVMGSRRLVRHLAEKLGVKNTALYSHVKRIVAKNNITHHSTLLRAMEYNKKCYKLLYEV